MDNTRTETRKLTLDEYVDLIYILKKHLWSIEVKIDETKEKYEKADYAPLRETHKGMHDSLVDQANSISTTISTIEENSLSLWSDKESGQ